jgi:hypothetical protein
LPGPPIQEVRAAAGEQRVVAQPPSIAIASSVKEPFDWSMRSRISSQARGFADQPTVDT